MLETSPDLRAVSLHDEIDFRAVARMSAVGSPGIATISATLQRRDCSHLDVLGKHVSFESHTNE